MLYHRYCAFFIYIYIWQTTPYIHDGRWKNSMHPPKNHTWTFLLWQHITTYKTRKIWFNFSTYGTKMWLCAYPWFLAKYGHKDILHRYLFDVRIHSWPSEVKYKKVFELHKWLAGRGQFHFCCFSHGQLYVDCSQIRNKKIYGRCKSKKYYVQRDEENILISFCLCIYRIILWKRFYWVTCKSNAFAYFSWSSIRQHSTFLQITKKFDKISSL